METLDEIEERYSKRNLLNELLSKCTEKQQKFFHHIHEKHLRNGVVKEENLNGAIAICKCTIKSNEENKNL